MCLHALQMACDFRDLLITNEQKNVESCEDEGISEDEKDPAPTKKTPKTHKRKQSSTQSTPKPAKKVKVSETTTDSDENESESSPNGETPAKQIKKPKNSDASKSSNATSTGEDEEEQKEPVQCFHCPKTFVHKKSRTDHIYVHHVKRRYACVVPGCDHFVLQRFKMINHIKTKHKDELNEDEMAEMLERAKQAEAISEHPDLRVN